MLVSLIIPLLLLSPEPIIRIYREHCQNSIKSKNYAHHLLYTHFAELHCNKTLPL